MFYLYTKALENKLKKVLSEDRVIYTSVAKFYDDYLFKTKNKNLRLPAISLWRDKINIHNNDAKTQMRIPNIVEKDVENLKQKELSTIVFDIDMTISLWTGSDKDNDDFLCEMEYFLNRYPNIEVEYDGKKFIFELVIGKPSDETDISQFENIGDIYRSSIPISIEHARMFYKSESDLYKFLNIKYFIDNEEDKGSK